MALVNMKTLLAEAQAGGYAIGAFSVANMESTLGVIRAAEERNAPVILQVAEARLPASPLWMIGPMMLAAAKQAGVRVAVHFDHGLTLDRIQEALGLGFTSVMYDGSLLPLEQNIRNTRQVMELARPFGAAVEAEVGSLGKAEDGTRQKAVCASAEDCLRMTRETGVDALAVAIGNAHGVYAEAPRLRFDVLEDLRGKADTPWVLHGGTGLTDADFRRAISLGMRKVNIATDIFQAAANGTGADLFAKIGNTVQAVAAVAARYIEIFGCAGKEKHHAN